LVILNRQEPQRRWLCILAGHGDLRRSLEAKIHDGGLTNRVTIVDGAEDMEGLFSIAEFGVLPSVRDGGIPYTIMEGASLKKPFIASHVGGVPEFIKHGTNGLLVPPNDSSALADSIGCLLRDPRKVRRLGRHALECYRKRHSTTAFLDQTLAVYERLLQGGL
jgi:glycosyltransferase involved in cell wall biosynthesis